MSILRNRINFLKTFRSDKNIGALAASSRFVVRSVLAYMPRDTRTIVECGPGDGVMTRELLHRLPSDGTLLAIEANKDFTALLRNIHDQRFNLVEGRVQDIVSYVESHNLGLVDFAVASIPFSFLPPSERIQIVRDVYKLLKLGGVFVIFNYSPLMYGTMKKIFGNTNIAFEVRNIPPCSIMIARKEK